MDPLPERPTPESPTQNQVAYTSDPTPTQTPLPGTSQQPPQQPIPGSSTNSSSGMTILVILALIFMYPLGVILMWVFMKHWQKWVKVLLTVGVILIPLLILPIVLGITLIAINPEKQFAQSNDTKRRSDVNAILNGVNMYAADNSGNIATLAIPVSPAAPNTISNTGVNLCTLLVPNYLAALPVDPLTDEGNQVEQSECTTAHDTNYTIVQAIDGRITVSAPGTEIDPVDISVTR